MRPAVVVIGPAQDAHAAAVVARLSERGVDVRLFDTAEFPDVTRISLGERLGDIAIDGVPARPAAVYIRNLGLTPLGVNPAASEEMEQDWRRAMLAYRERADVVAALVHRWESLGVPVYNPQSTRHRITKPYQIALLADAGLPVPRSLWTNDPDQVRRFATGRRVAYKPVAGGAATKELAAGDLSDERLSRLGAAPVCFQELLPGDDIRVYVIDDDIVASVKIVTDALDFRGSEQSIEPYPLSAELAQVCLRATRTLGLRFTGMDLKADEAGDLKILELNPSPMFLGFDKLSGSDIGDRLCAALARHAA
jgi:glutathione synthase/RimK-type ligase-like ATP-grasp enzyme